MTGSKRSGIVLQARDLQLLKELALMRVADREQVKCVGGFSSTRKTNERLLSLTQAGLLRRFFQGSAAGGKKALYALSQKGAELAGVPRRGPRRGRDEFLVADYYVSHQLEINRIYCELKRPLNPLEGAQFIRWVDFSEPIATSTPLVPDGYFEIVANGTTVAAFLEIDLGHESQKIWNGKVQNYLQYAISGAFPKQFGHSQFRVLVIANSSRRLSSLRNTTAAITEKIFWFTTMDSVRANGLWGPIWHRPRTELLQPLL